jgi:NADPH:quinone reductase-like Zn-dependent oxidoreductase
MIAATYYKYGPPEVIKITEIDKPIPKSDEVLIKVLASTVNRTDTGFRSALYFVSRFWSGLLKPKFNVLGCEYAGIIEEIGVDVNLFKIGDTVFGFNDKTMGGNAEYIAVKQIDSVAIMPSNVNFEQAAAITEGAHYALCDIRAAKVKFGQNVLVYGATGAIGSAAVQLLNYFGANVTAVCNTKNVALIKSLGANKVIDYLNEDFTKTDQKYDFIYDAVGKSSFTVCKPLLKKKGIYKSTELGSYGSNIFLALITPLLGGKKVLFPIPTINKEDVLFLKELVETNQFKPVIDRTYNITLIIEAHKYVETGQKTGNVIIEFSK